MKSTIQIILSSSGNVVAISGSLGFNPSVLANPVFELTPESRAAGMTLTTNLTGNPQSLGWLLDSASAFPSGEVPILNVTFDIISQVTERAPNDTLTVLPIQGYPTPFSASDLMGNSLSLGAHGSLIDVATGIGQASGITAGASPVLPAYADLSHHNPPSLEGGPTPVSVTPIPSATPPSPTPVVTPTPVVVPTPAPVPTPTPLANITDTIQNAITNLESNKTLLYGGLAVVGYLLFFSGKKGGKR